MQGKWGWAWAAVSLVWLATIAWLARGDWPRLSLDMSPSDPQVQAALANAVVTHLLRYGGLAFIPPALAYVAMRTGRG